MSETKVMPISESPENQVNGSSIQKIEEQHHREHERNKMQECPNDTANECARTFFRKSKGVLNPLIHFRLLHFHHSLHCRESMW